MTDLPGKTAQAAATGLTGQVFSASDVSGQPDEPLPGQAVIAIPEAEAARILGLNSPASDEQLRFLKSSIGAAEPHMGVTVSDRQGMYNLALPPGHYTLCVGEENVSGAVTFPLRTRGCGRVVVPQEGVKPLNISSGFGEILLVGP